MDINFGHKYKALAGIVGVVSLALFIAMYKNSGAPETQVSELEAEHSSEEGSPPDEPLSSALPSDHSVIDDDYSRSRQKVYAQKARVSIDVNIGQILVDAVEATMHDVLRGLVDKALVTVVDLRPEDEPVAEKQSFRFSGSIDDVLRFVMEKYNYSYVISHVSSTGTQLQTPVTKLFLYGTMQGEDTGFASEQSLSPASAEAGSAADYPESGGSPGINLERDAKNQAIVSDILRKRALSTASQAASSASSGISQKPTLSGESSPVDSAPLTGTYEDEAMRARLAEMTRRASEEVQALAAELKKAEKSLEVQRNNQYGETGQ